MSATAVMDGGNNELTRVAGSARPGASPRPAGGPRGRTTDDAALALRPSPRALLRDFTRYFLLACTARALARHCFFGLREF